MAASQIVDSWFGEKEQMWPGQRFSLKVKGDILYAGKSKYQDIMVFDSTDYGRVLVLDGVIQLTERDEFAYQESIAHLPMFAHPNPKSVLIVGGGDGGVAREVARHAGVKKIVMCEIDEDVCKVAKKFFPKMASTLIAKDEGREPRFELLFMDAAEYMKGHKNEFDVIIVDSSDPVGPAETLYSSEFYANMHAALRPGGIVCTQGECQWLHLPLISKVIGDAKQLYPTVEYAFASVPTYPSGQIGFIIARKAQAGLAALFGGGALAQGRAVPVAMRKELRYYSEAVHRACFVLPRFAEKELPAAAVPAAGAPAALVALAALAGAAAAALFLRRK